MSIQFNTVSNLPACTCKGLPFGHHYQECAYWSRERLGKVPNESKVDTNPSYEKLLKMIVEKDQEIERLKNYKTKAEAILQAFEDGADARQAEAPYTSNPNTPYTVPRSWWARGWNFINWKKENAELRVKLEILNKAASECDRHGECVNWLSDEVSAQIDDRERLKKENQQLRWKLRYEIEQADAYKRRMDELRGKLEATEKHLEIIGRNEREDAPRFEVAMKDAERYRKLRAEYKATGRLALRCNPRMLTLDEIVDCLPEIPREQETRSSN